MPRRGLVLLACAVGFAPPLRSQTLGPRIHRVSIGNFTFMPPRLEVSVGDSIEFTNTDFVPHTATADDAAWDTAELKYGAAARVIVTASGAFGYRCIFHPHMTGAIVATPGPVPAR